MGTNNNAAAAAKAKAAAAAEAAKAKASAEAAAKPAPEASKASDALVKIGKDLLESNPNMSVVYITSDGRGFYEQNDAENYARTLKNTAVAPVKK